MRWSRRGWTSVGALHRTAGKSKDLCIGHTERESGIKVLRDWTSKGVGYESHTTSTHVNKARPYADKVCKNRAEFENFDIINKSTIVIHV